jgi:hypothetical protein
VYNRDEAPPHAPTLEELPTVPDEPKPFVVKSNTSIDTYKLKKRVEPVKGCRVAKKKDMEFNDTTPRMDVDAETFVSSYPHFFHYSSHPFCRLTFLDAYPDHICSFCRL